MPQNSIELPYLLDFYPLQSEEHTRIHAFFDALKQGKLTTTRCTACRALHWQPRVVCPECLSEALEWVELPGRGTVYAHTALLKGAPLGMESELPITIALVELDVGTAKLRVLSRVDGAGYDDLRIGSAVNLKVVKLPDERVFYRFEPAR